MDGTSGLTAAMLVCGLAFGFGCSANQGGTCLVLAADELHQRRRPSIVHGGEKTIQWSACVCAGAGGVKVGHWIG